VKTNGFGEGFAQVTDRYRLANDQIHGGGFFVGILHHSTEAGEHNDGHFWIDRSDGRCHLVAVHVGHGAVHDHEIETAFAKLLQPLGPAVGTVLAVRWLP